MVKSISPNDGNFTQECGSCQTEHLHQFTNLTSAITGKVMKLPACGTCGSLEFLLLNGGKSSHDVLVAQVFAYVKASS